MAITHRVLQHPKPRKNPGGQLVRFPAPPFILPPIQGMREPGTDLQVIITSNGTTVQKIR